MAYQPYSLGQFNLTAPILTSGNFSPLQLDVNGRLLVSSGSTTDTTQNDLILQLLIEVRRTNLILMSMLPDTVKVPEDFKNVEDQV